MMNPRPAEVPPQSSPATDVAADSDLPPDYEPIRLQPWQRWLVLALVLFFLYEARTIVGPFIIAGVIAYIFTGGVTVLTRRLGWPRLLVAAILYLLTLGILGTLIYFAADALVRETIDLGKQGPNLLEAGITQLFGPGKLDIFGQQLDPHTIAIKIDQALSEFGGAGALHYGEIVVSRLLEALLVIVVSFYLIVDGNKLGAYLLKFIPQESRSAVGYLAGRIHTALGAYIRGQLVLIALMSAVTFLVLTLIFHLKYALPLAIATGFLEVLPYIGPAAAAIMASGVALAQYGPGAALGVVIAYLILRQLEDQLVMPFVVGRAVDLHPLATIFAVLAGGAVAGVLGVLLAVPTAAALKIILDYLYPSSPENAVAQARHGMRRAAREAEEE